MNSCTGDCETKQQAGGVYGAMAKAVLGGAPNQKESQVKEQIARLESWLGRLDNSIDRVEARIGIVLRSAKPNHGKPTQSEPSPDKPAELVPLAAVLEGLICKAQDCVSKLEYLFDRIEL